MQDITGEKFSRLTAIKYSGRRTNRDIMWLFRCDCGNLKTIRKTDVRKLRTRSCGCLQRESATTIKNNFTHGMTRTLFLASRLTLNLYFLTLSIFSSLHSLERIALHFLH